MMNIMGSDNKYSTTQLMMQNKSMLKQKEEGGLRIKESVKKSFKDKPLISIVTVVFNGERHLEQTIQSVINQTYDNVEYIIIDGGSTDGTLDIIKKYENQIDYWVSEPDNGIYSAMNKGVSLCTGEYIGFLNADDWYVLDTLKMISEYLMYEKPGYIFGDTDLYENELYKSTMKSNLTVYRKGTPVGHQALFVKKKYLLEYPFEIKFKRYADYDFMIKIIDLDLEYIQLDLVVVNYRMGGFSSTGDIHKEKFFIQYRHFGLIYALSFYMRVRMYPFILSLKKFFRWESKS